MLSGCSGLRPHTLVAEGLRRICFVLIVLAGGQIARWLQRLEASYTSSLRPEAYIFCTDSTNRRADCSVAAASTLAEAA